MDQSVQVVVKMAQLLPFSLNATGVRGNTTSANITVGTLTRTFDVTTATDSTNV